MKFYGRIFHLLFVLFFLAAMGCSQYRGVPTTDSTEQVMIEAVITEKAQVENLVRVYFATNREKTLLKSPGERFNYVLTDELSYGHCDVSIPINHVKGKMEYPKFYKFWNRNDTEQYLLLVNTEVYDNFERFSLELKNDDDNLFIFVHGYNVAFGDAARRTAQMVRDLEFKGKGLFFSWPSRSKLLRYKTDSETEIATRPILEKFLVSLSERFPEKKLYIVAHSMGTNLLSNAIVSISKNNSTFRHQIRGLVLAAPDIASNSFRDDIVPALNILKAPVTVYASNNDFALKLSEWYWEGPRRGKNIFGSYNLDVIDATKVDTDWLGHSYYGSSKEVLIDTERFLMSPAVRADSRQWLEKRSDEGSPYWFLPPKFFDNDTYKKMEQLSLEENFVQ